MIEMTTLRLVSGLHVSCQDPLMRLVAHIPGADTLPLSGPDINTWWIDPAKLAALQSRGSASAQDADDDASGGSGDSAASATGVPRSALIIAPILLIVLVVLVRRSLRGSTRHG